MKITPKRTSRYIKTDDLKGREVLVVVDRVEEHEIEGNDGEKQDKYVLYFQNKEKGLVMNVTNTEAMVNGFGDESDAWTGKDVMLFSVQTPMGPGLRIRPLSDKPADEEPPPF